MLNIRTHIIETIKTGQDLVNTIYIIDDTSNFNEYFKKIESLKELSKSYGIDSEIYKAINLMIPKYDSEKYKINLFQKIYYLLASTRMTMNRVLIRNTEEHRIKRYILQINMTLDYINNSIIKKHIV